MGKGLDTGKTFLQGVLSKITDPGQRAAAETLLASETFVTEIGNGVEGQSEIDKRLRALTTQREELDARAADVTAETERLTQWHGGLTTWFEENKAAIEEAKRVRAGGVKPNGDGKPAGGAPAGLTAEAMDERLQAERAAFLGFSRDQNIIEREHFMKFKELPDLEPLLQHPQIGKIGLRGVYDLVHKERLDKFAADAKTSAEEAIRLDERTKVLASTAALPYITPTGVGSGSPLDALSVGKPDSVADAASAHYNRILAERHAAGTPAS